MPHSVSIIFWILLLSLGFIWGSSFYAVSVSLNTFQPLQIASGRILIGALVLTVLCFNFGDGLPSLTIGDRKIWLYSFGMGIFTNVIPFSLLSWAQTEVSSSFAGVTMSLVPFITLTLAHYLITGEELSINKSFGLLIGFLGMLILFDFHNFFDRWNGFSGFKFKLACFGAAACYSIGAIITRRSPTNSKLAFSASGLIAGSIIIIPVTLLVEGMPIFSNSESFWAIVYLGVIPTGLATVILVTIIKGVGPTFLSLVNYLVPVWAIIFGVLINSEGLKVSFVLALAFIFSGMVISQR